MRRGKFKVRSKNSMGILVLIVFLALIPIIICLTELERTTFYFSDDKSVNKGKTNRGRGCIRNIHIGHYTVNNFNCSQCVDWVEYL